MATVEEARAWLKAYDERKSKFYAQHEAEISRLIATCHKFRGEYIPSTHGRGSWATTYSNEFVAAASKLYVLLEAFKGIDPIDELSLLFRKHGITSCRGATMDTDRVDYLYVTHLRRHIRNHR